MLEYKVVEGWGNIPPGWSFGHVIGVAVDSGDNVYVYNRGEHPVVIFDQEGRFLSSWGEGMFTNPHCIYIDHEDNVFCIDSGDHTVRKLTLDGELLLTLGKKGVPAKDGDPFNRPSDVAVTSSGDIYISDGYGNNRVHKFSSDGKHLFSWGELGEGAGQFNLPHGIWVEEDKFVYVADRQNHRIQIFTLEGEFLNEWVDFRQPCHVYIDDKKRVYVPELQARMSVLDMDGNLLARWGGVKSNEPGFFIAPHASWLDSKGDLYIGETLEGSRIQKFILK
jgi:DNA-binding beta-propeller fold protein YncE